MSKYHLTELIHGLSKEEIRAFRLYSSRVKQQGENHTSQLFDLIKDAEADEFSEKVVHWIYDKPNKNAYYRMKGRLLEDVEQSLLILNRSADDQHRIMDDLRLALVFKQKSKYKKALFYLKRGVKRAEKGSFLHVLDLLYHELLSLAKDYYIIDPVELIESRNVNRDRIREIQEIEESILKVNYRLKNANFSNKEVDLTQQLEEIVNQSIERRETKKIPAVQVEIHKCIRTTLLQSGKFFELEEYLKKSFEEFSKDGLFNKSGLESKISMLNWLINISVVNKKFEQSLHFGEQLNQRLSDEQGKYRKRYEWMYYQSLILAYTFTNRLPEVIELLERIDADDSLSGTNFYDIFTKINLAITYYCMGEIDTAIDHFIPVVHSEIFKKLSRSLQLNASIVELILHYEKGNLEFCLNRIQEMKRVFRKELKALA